MRIGFDAKRAFSNFSGLGNYSRSTIRILNEYYSENDYFLYTPRVPSEDQIKFLNLPTHARAHIRIPKSFFFETFSAAWRRYGIAADAAHDQLDLYHGLSHEIPSGIEKTKIKTVVTIHDLIFKRFPSYYKAADRRIYDKKFKAACINADKIIAISEQTKKDIIQFYEISESKIETIYQSCSSIFYLERSKEYLKTIAEKYNLPANFLLTVGTIEERKNTLLILKSMVKMKSDIPIVFVGRKKSYSKKLDEFILQNNLTNRVQFITSIDFEDLPAIYQLASVFIYPSRFEGFGIPIIEALHSKVPVIATTGSCLEEAGGPNSIYVDPDDDISLSKHLDEILSNEHLRNDMIAEGIKYVHKFKDEVIAEKLIQLYKKILKA